MLNWSWLPMELMTISPPSKSLNNTGMAVDLHPLGSQFVLKQQRTPYVLWTRRSTNWGPWGITKQRIARIKRPDHANHDLSRVKAYSMHDYIDFQLSRTFCLWTKTDSPSQRFRPMSTFVLWELTMLTCLRSTSQPVATADLMWIGVFVLLCASEYLCTSLGNTFKLL